MIGNGFDMHRVFISAPGDLKREQDTCRDAISEVNEKEAMPHRALLVPVGLNHDDQIVVHRSAVADNIRQCAFFIQVFEDDWGPKNLFRKMFYVATECRDNKTFPMRDIAVFLKAAPRETDPEILAFRQEIEERQDIRIFHFEGMEGFKAQMLEVCSGWARSILGAAAGQ